VDRVYLAGESGGIDRLQHREENPTAASVQPTDYEARMSTNPTNARASITILNSNGGRFLGSDPKKVL